MRIAILGATSQIAKDLILSFAAHSRHELVLYARRPEAVVQWLNHENLVPAYTVADFAAFTTQEHFDAILNFVGVGNPAQTAAMGASIFDVTLKYDELALGYVQRYPTCRYIFLSSGAAYGSSFEAPADVDTKATIDINHLQPQDWYGVAKLHAECRHRSLAHLAIVDIRVFNYFSHTQDIEARFLMTDILRAVRDKTVLKTSAENIVRDFLHPSDFYQLVSVMLAAPSTNAAIDGYSRAPINKTTLLAVMQNRFNLRYEACLESTGVNATGSKRHYFSKNLRAAEFGYAPVWNSIDGICHEAELILNSSDAPYPGMPATSRLPNLL
ncbi:MAG: NAD-dependent epimerase/dehydratase family protein [Rhodoferax sp.]|nr:NAD-dependent epimerase/dehydratase family protein [Rhodoferax sp.]